MPDDMDLLLDAALRSYADPGPDSGLEQRILHNVAQHAAVETRPAWRSRLLWASGFSLVATCLLLVWIFAPRLKTNLQASVERRTPQTRATRMPEAVATIQPVPLHRKSLVRRALTQPASAPKLAVFPMPTPLSPQERSLVRLVSVATAEQRKDLIAAQQLGDAPLRIATISIPSLEPPQKDKE